MRLSLKIALLFTLLSFIVIGFVSFIFFVKGRKIIEDNTIAHIVTVNDMKQDALECWISSRKKLIESIASLPLCQKGRDISVASSDKKRKMMMPFINEDHFSEMFLVDINSGVVMLSTDPLQEGKFKDDQAFFIYGKKGIYVQSIYYDVSAQMPVMIFSIPVHTDAETPSAILAAKASLTSLADIFEKRNQNILSEDSYLVNKFNYYVTEPRFGQNFALKKSISTKPILQGRKSGHYLGEHTDYRGESVIGEARWLSSHDLFLITEMDQKEAYASILHLKKKILVIMVAISLVAAFFGWWLSFFITRPLVALQRAAVDIGRGNLDIDLKISGSMEVRKLAAAFTKMTKDLKSTMVSKEKLEAEITERKIVQEQLRKSVISLRQSNEDLQQFAYVASHDLQEPLRMVASFTQLLAERYREKLDDRAMKWIDFAVDGAQRMQRLIQDLLSFSRVHTHGQDFEMIQMSDVIKEAEKNLQAAIEESGTTISTQDLPVVKADFTQMVQLFQNLITNAIKFCPDGPPLIKISAQKKEKEWEFCVKDNGIGIDPQFMQKIFIIFKRLHTREQYPGTGIGLAVCKRILQRHSGKIWVTSEPGKGSRFYFTLPI